MNPTSYGAGWKFPLRAGRLDNTSHSWLWLKRQGFIHLVLLPRVLFSRGFFEQLQLLRKNYPNASLRLKVLRTRSWGREVSLQMSAPFLVDFEVLGLSAGHPEVEAVAAGGRKLDDFRAKALLSGGWTEQYLEERLRKTRLLLTAKSEDLFSEAKILDDGSLFIHDGYHRLGVQFHRGLPGARIVVSIPINLQ